MSDLSVHHSNLGSLCHKRNGAKLRRLVQIQTSQVNNNHGIRMHGRILMQPRDISGRSQMVKVDTQAGVHGHSVAEMPGRDFLVSPWLAGVAWSMILIFIALTIAGFILAYQARKEFRMRVEEQRKLLESQAAEEQPKTSMSVKELKTFTRKSIMLLNSPSQNYTPAYRISVAGNLMPRNVFDRPCRDSILVAQITPQSASFSQDDPYYEFSRRVARESFWDPAIRKSIMSVASLSSVIPRMPKMRNHDFAMMEHLDDNASDQENARRHPQHASNAEFRRIAQPPDSSNLRVQGRHVQFDRYVPPVPPLPSYINEKHTVTTDPVSPPRQDVEPSVNLDATQNDSSADAPTSPLANAQYTSSGTKTPEFSQTHSRSNSFLRFVRRSLTPRQPATTPSEPLTPENDGDSAIMQPMNVLHGDPADLLGDPFRMFDCHLLQPSFTHSVIYEEDEDDVCKDMKVPTVSMKSGAIKNQQLDPPFPRSLPQAVLNDTASISANSSFTSSTHRPRLKLNPSAAFASSDDESESPRVLSDSPRSLTSFNPYGPRKRKIKLPSSPSEGLSSPRSATPTQSTFSSRLQPSIYSNSGSSHDKRGSDMTQSSYGSQSNSRPQSNPRSQLDKRPQLSQRLQTSPHPQSNPSRSLTLKQVPSLSTNPYARQGRPSELPTSPRDDMRMTSLKNQKENLKRPSSNPNTAVTTRYPSLRNAPVAAAASPMRRAASAQARLPLGGTMSSGGVRDSSFVP